MYRNSDDADWSVLFSVIPKLGFAKCHVSSDFTLGCNSVLVVLEKCQLTNKRSRRLQCACNNIFTDGKLLPFVQCPSLRPRKHALPWPNRSSGGAYAGLLGG